MDHLKLCNTYIYKETSTFNLEQRRVVKDTQTYMYCTFIFINTFMQSFRAKLDQKNSHELQCTEAYYGYINS